jgi:hypothetical protein
MRYVRMASSAVAVACALVAAVASGASAAQFIASKGKTTTGSFDVRGAAGTEGEQTLTAGGTPVKCAVSHGKGTVTVPAGVLLASLSFSHCTAEVRAGGIKSTVKVAVGGALEIEYLPEGAVRVLRGVTLHLPALGCTFDLAGLKEVGFDKQIGGEEEPRLLPEAATYANEKVSTSHLSTFPTGFQDKLALTSGVLMQDTLVEPSRCEAEEGGSSSSGAGAGKVPAGAGYSGTIPLEVSGGDLGIEEEEGVLPGGWNRVKNQEVGPEF